MNLLPWFETTQCAVALTQLDEADHNKTIVPNYENVFDAYSYTSVTDVRVVILGYTNIISPSTGLIYSGQPSNGVDNIFTELQLDYGSVPTDYSLTGWANQGVMLLNCSLTTTPEVNWNDLIDETIYAIAQETTNTVFMLWGSESVKRSKFISPNQHLMLLGGDPVDEINFFGKRMFTRANLYLNNHGRGTIDWYR